VTEPKAETSHKPSLRQPLGKTPLWPGDFRFDKLIYKREESQKSIKSKQARKEKLTKIPSSALSPAHCAGGLVPGGEHSGPYEPYHWWTDLLKIKRTRALFQTSSLEPNTVLEFVAYPHVENGSSGEQNSE
jgi:hypothetical protein